jgi:predicted ABC-type ATPase
MDNARPHLLLIAGPNGSGKTTLARAMEAAVGLPNYVNVDELALEHGGDVGAGARQALELCRRYLETGASFIRETTLTGKGILRMIERARQRDYIFKLIFTSVCDVAESRRRVASRVLQGGHDVPTADLIRRFPQSHENAKTASILADQTSVLTNSTGGRPTLAATLSSGHLEYLSSDAPAWVRRLVCAHP